MSTDALQSNWNYPTQMKVGPGRIQELALSCHELAIRAPLLVTDPGLAELPMVHDALKQCLQAGLECEIFNDIQANPTGSNIDAGTQAYHAGQHDGVIAFGGGSALDAGKAIALMSGQERPLFDFVDEADNWLRVNAAAIAPVIAVPTTAGTGSEVGRASVITDETAQLKKIIFHPGMLPAQVILDARLTIGLPADITAATGMDALSHNLEALCATGFHPMAEGIALEGIRLVHEYLQLACSSGANLVARSQMLAASTMGATAFQRGLGAMHALAHPLGALYNAHHGLLNAVLMPYVLKANGEAIDQPLCRAARYLGLARADADGFRERILDLRASIGIPHTLAEIGIDDTQAERIGLLAVADPSAAGNPVHLSAEQYSELFIDAVNGVL
jgi:alcohol dehydrogenase class IV